MLLWWRQWVQEQQQQEELLERSCYHMEAYLERRCLAVWYGRVLRKQQLWDLLQQGLLMSKQLAAQTAFRGWREVRQAAELVYELGHPQALQGIAASSSCQPTHSVWDGTVSRRLTSFCALLAEVCPEQALCKP